MSNLADQQAALVAALVGAAEVPAGFDASLVVAARAALLRKRAGEVAAAWPLTAAAYGHQWTATFSAWAAGRPPAGALRDGWDFARSAATRPGLPDLAREELADREARFSYDGTSAPRPRTRWRGLLRALTARPH
jgi:hypothetical protein